MEELLMYDILIKLQDQLISSVIEELAKKGELKDFIKFGREEAKKDGRYTEELQKFFDEIEEQFCDNIDWDKLFDIVGETTNNRKVMGFRQDKCIIVENRTLSHDEVEEYMETETAPINLDKLNKALEPINIKLEFIEAIDNPFDLDGFQNFVRFKVVELD